MPRSSSPCVGRRRVSARPEPEDEFHGVPEATFTSFDGLAAFQGASGLQMDAGINFFDKFLLPAGEYGKRRATLDDVTRHIRHICDLAGNADHVALGTDMDGGLGRNEIPREIQTSADLPRVADALAACGLHT